jgi:hypothetical protein
MSIDADARRELLSRPVSVLELSVRASTCLRGAKVETIGDLVEMSEAQLLKRPGLGRKTLAELRLAMSEIGLWQGRQLGQPLVTPKAPTSVRQQNRRLAGYLARALLALESHGRHVEQKREKLAARKLAEAVREVKNGVADANGTRG